MRHTYKTYTTCIQGIPTSHAYKALISMPARICFINANMRVHHVKMHTYIRTCIRINHSYMHTYKHTCMHACMHACMHTYIHTHIHTYIHVCVRIYTHTGKGQCRSGADRTRNLAYHWFICIRQTNCDPIYASSLLTAPIVYRHSGQGILCTIG